MEPRNDDWSSKGQLDLYLFDLVEQSNSLTYGLFDGEDLVGVSRGRIKHWYSGTEYCIDEFCIQTNKQRRGIGTFFLKELEKDMMKIGSAIIRMQMVLQLHQCWKRPIL